MDGGREGGRDGWREGWMDGWIHGGMDCGAAMVMIWSIWKWKQLGVKYKYSHVVCTGFV